MNFIRKFVLDKVFIARTGFFDHCLAGSQKNKMLSFFRNSGKGANNHSPNQTKAPKEGEEAYFFQAHHYVSIMKTSPLSHQRILLSLYSLVDNSAAIAVYNLKKQDYELVYKHIFPKDCPKKNFRGMDWLGNYLYAVCPKNLYIFEISAKDKRPYLQLKKVLCLPEWSDSQVGMGNLCALHVSKKQQRVFVGCTAQDVVDEFSLYGEHKKRHDLKKLVPHAFLASSPRVEGFGLGYLTNIFEEPAGTLCCTLAYSKAPRKGVVLNLSLRQIVLDNLDYPHDGLIFWDCLFINSPERKALEGYPYAGLGTVCPNAKPKKKFSVLRTDETTEHESGYLRGLLIDRETIVCGLSYFSKIKDKNVRPRLLTFEKNRKEPVSESGLPDLEGLRLPCVYSIRPVPEAWYLFLEQGRGSSGRISADSLFSLPLEEISSFDPAIALNNVSLFYRRKVSLLKAGKGLGRKKRFWALKEISFYVNKGESIGIIGSNGSGKSTLALLIAGVYKPDQGQMEVEGKVDLLVLGTGLKPEMSGQENIYINAAYLGFEKSYIDDHLQEIIDFAELGSFIHEPVRSYSSGMRSRLMFSVAAIMQPDILIIDEVMATGDQAFKKKAENKLSQIIGSSKAVIIISHDNNQIKKMCDRVIWLEAGRIRQIGEPEEVVQAYTDFVYKS